MSTEQIVATISITPIIAQCFVEGQCVDAGISQSLLARIFRDHLQAAWPTSHASVGYHDSPMSMLKIHQPGMNTSKRARIRDIFAKILQRENWLVAVQ